MACTSFTSCAGIGRRFDLLNGISCHSHITNSSSPSSLATASRFAAALWLRPDLLPLAVECGRALIETGRPQAWLDLLPSLPQACRGAGRVRLLEGQAALVIGDLARVEPLFTERIEVNDLREGELSLSELWFGYHERKISAAKGVPLDETLQARVRREFPVPEHLDFRVKGS